MSAYGSVDLAIDAIKAGAYDYISKPFKQDEVLLALTKAEERESLRRENRALKQGDAQGADLPRHPRKERSDREGVRDDREGRRLQDDGLDPRRERHRQGARRSRASRGQHAQGQALRCRSTAARSPRRFSRASSSATTKGRSPMRTRTRRGSSPRRTKARSSSTRSASCPCRLQVKLLRVLQEGRVRPLGATTRSRGRRSRHRGDGARPAARSREKRFREDLYYRLNVLQISVPPLRDRRDDVTLLVEHFIERNNGRLGTKIRDVDPRAREATPQLPVAGQRARAREHHRARGGARGGRRHRRRRFAGAHARAGRPGRREPLTGELSIKKTARFMEETLIRKALEQTGGNRTAASKLLEISHRALLYKIKDYGIQ